MSNRKVAKVPVRTQERGAKIQYVFWQKMEEDASITSGIKFVAYTSTTPYHLRVSACFVLQVVRVLLVPWLSVCLYQIGTLLRVTAQTTLKVIVL